MAQFQQQLLAYLPPAVRNLLGSGPGRELLRKIDTTLMLDGEQLLHGESGNSTAIAAESSGAVGNEKVSARDLAAAAARLLQGNANRTNKANKARDAYIQLLLPPSEFVATTQSMPGLSRDNLASAVKLQAESLLPACEQELALAVNPGSAELGDEHIALWVPEARLSELFEAFKQEELILAVIKPRVLGAVSDEVKTQLIDYDAHGATAVNLQDGVIRQWLQINAVDFEHAEFAEQWQQAIAARPNLPQHEYRSVEDYKGKLDKSEFQDYSFFPRGALSARSRVDKGRKLLLAAASVAGLMLLSSIPFALQSLEFRQAAASLDVNRGMSVEARQDQAIVVGFESEWGPISDYPQQNIREAMFTLQQVLSPDQLSSLEISEGLIKIQGTSADPQAILQRLEQDPLFTEVIFSRATNNTRYYIDLRLSPVNFEGYMVRYFPDD